MNRIDNNLLNLFLAGIAEEYGELLEKEYKFHPTRKFRFDYAFPRIKLAVEFEGGIWVQGRHTKGAGYAKDCFKYNSAADLGWTVLRYTPASGHDELKFITNFLERKKN